MKGQFAGATMSRSARQAAKLNGLSRVDTWDVVSHVNVRDADLDGDVLDVVVIRAYSASGRKVVDITAGDLYMVETEYQDVPMASV